MSTSITHDSDSQRFVLSIEGQKAGTLDYSRGGGVVSITHTYTNPEFRGQGIAGTLTAHAVDELSGLFGEPINPACPYVAHWFEQHQDKKHLRVTDTD
ncbi:MAG: GNAT family N-acetyltransferase [Mycetocola sp.]